LHRASNVSSSAPVSSSTQSISASFPRAGVISAALLALSVSAAVSQVAPPSAEPKPTATLLPAPELALSGTADSNSPAVWELRGGVPTLQVITSVDGHPSLAIGRRLGRLGPAEPVTFASHPGDGIWMESVIVDEGGTWYGYYHNEVPATMCGRPDRTLPRIGAARSRDGGTTWEDLGIVLEAPPGFYDCATPNAYFVGGVGDVNVLLDRDSRDLYFFFSQYSAHPLMQGVAVARLPWAARDEPAGQVQVWVNGVWRSAVLVPSEGEDGVITTSWNYPAGSPLAPVMHPWHDADPENDAFWGASVHWNTAIQRYVMLLNRAKDEQFTQEGIYISFARVLDDPTGWTPPEKLVDGGAWYPQVIGLENGQGSDKQAGARARFFVAGQSHAFIDFALR
jgi:hypothetical protein